MSDLEEVVAEARKHGMSYGKYVDKLKQEGQMTQELKEQIIADYESGLSANEIAKKHKINPTTTQNNPKQHIKLEGKRLDQVCSGSRTEEAGRKPRAYPCTCWQH